MRKLKHQLSPPGGCKWLNQGGMSGEHEKKERNPEECQRSRGMADRLEMGGRQALQTTSGSDQWTNSIRNKNYLLSHGENSYY